MYIAILVFPNKYNENIDINKWVKSNFIVMK